MSKHLVNIIVVLSLPCVVFLNTLQNGFHLDDFYIVKDNPGIHSFYPPWRHFVDARTISTLDRITQYRPILPLTLSINYALFADSLLGYHLGNLVLHLLGVLLAYFLMIELLTHWTKGAFDHKEQRMLACIVSLFFAVHPVSGFLINYICARDEILMNSFLLASFFSYVRLRRIGGNSFRWCVTLLLATLSLLSKTNGLVLPILVFLFEITLGSKSLRTWRTWFMPLPFALVVLAHFSFVSFYLNFSDFTNAVASERSYLSYGLIQAKVHVYEYLKNFIWPFRIRQLPYVPPVSSVLDPGVLIGFLWILLTLIVAAFSLNKHPILPFCLLSYWALFVPTSSVVPLFYSVTHYRPYPPSLFLFLAVVYGAKTLLPRVIYGGLSLFFVLYYSLASFYLNTTWKTEEILWTHSIKYGAEPLAHMNLAMSIPNRHDARVRYHLEEALRRGPESVLAHVNLGLLLLELGELEKGLELCQKALQMAPTWAQPYYWISHAYSKLGKASEALDAALKAAALDQRNLEYQYRAALLLQTSLLFEESLEYIGRIAASDPSFKEVSFLKAFALQKLNRTDAAIATYRAFLLTNGNHTQAHFNLGFALMETGMCQEALPHFKRVLSLKPDYQEVLIYLARCGDNDNQG